ncbi:MAG: S1C family serine protease [Candidatus Magasanikbacteria bacterium]
MQSNITSKSKPLSVFLSVVIGLALVGISFFIAGYSNQNFSFPFFDLGEKKTRSSDKVQTGKQAKEEISKHSSKETGAQQDNIGVPTLEEATISVVEDSNPAVVNISIYREVSQRRQRIPEPFRKYFEIQPQPKPEQEKIKVGGGSGFIVDSSGVIVTNKHVVNHRAVSYKVELANGNTYDAKVIAKDPLLDLAIMKIEENNLPTLELGDSDKLKVGQTVIAIGNALSEFENTVTRGIVSGIGRKIQAGGLNGEVKVIDKAIQTDAAINPGNSGGPLLNLKGEVVGINTAVSEQGQAVGFAIPINQVKSTINSVIKNGKIVRPWLGVRYLQINPRIAEMNNLKVGYGALVIRGDSRGDLAVVPGSPADKAGLEENDIILEVNGEKLKGGNTLRTMISKQKVGEKIELTILQDGEKKQVTVELGKMPQDL